MVQLTVLRTIVSSS